MKKLKKLTLKELENSVVVMQGQSQMAIVAGSASDPYYGSGWNGYPENGGGGWQGFSGIFGLPPDSYYTGPGNGGQFSFLSSYQNSGSGFTAAVNLSTETGKECGGFVFADGSVLLFQSTKDDCGNYNGPVPELVCINGKTLSVYNGKVIESAFHTHPTVSYASGDDFATQSKYFPNCELTILQGNKVTTYQYEEGIRVY